MIAAQRGASAKCLVLDCDDTLWGGVIGDDGLDGIELGPGSAAGEAFLAVQRHALDLYRRGVLLAICSKNDESIAIEAFARHPEMLLRPEHIACFVANWSDKATNLRLIAARLNIGLDTLVLLDDNAYERAQVRAALPMVHVPEIGDEPADYPRLLADAGYFEAVRVTADDRDRAARMRQNVQRDRLQAQSTDLADYLDGLGMRLAWRPFDAAGRARVVQLVNKTNQFNLTTRRYAEAEIAAVEADPDAFGLQFRLIDRLGDNGMIAVVIGRVNDAAVRLETWLMSCRVLGRGVEQAMLGVVAEVAAARGARSLIGEYRRTAKNAMVADLYPRLGFTPAADGSFHLRLDGYTPNAGAIRIEREPT